MSAKRWLLPALLSVLMIFSALPVTVCAEESLPEEDTAFLEQLLTALQEPELEAALNALQKGDPVTQGTVGETAKGLQKALVAFGCDIKVDGNAGPATFGALHQIQESFGLSPSKSVDADVYTELLALLLLSRDSKGEYDDLLRSHLGADEEGAYEYMQGCAFYAAGHYYRALEAFEESGYKDYEKRAASCEQQWPNNGELWHNSSITKKDMDLVFDVNSSDDSEGMCFEVYTEDGTLASVLFLTGSGSVKTSLPGGKYRIRDASGDTWYGLKDIFGRSGHYEYMYFNEFEEDEYLTALDAGYEWTISLNVSETDPDAAGVGSIDSDWDEWISEQ